ncbi:MAG: glycoside hydrolase family 140 protein, partial [Acidobacteria bacterium]|nr:glycoside hydrolase family 140 protein [Acidobacteriota bacterium]
MRNKAMRSLIFGIVATCFMLATTANAADDLTKPIRVSPDGHFLVQPDGEPFFWLGDTGWAIFERLTREETDEYLKDRANKGFTVIQAVAIGGPFDRLDVPNRYGELALIEKDPTRPNPRYFEHIDWVVNRAAHYGLRIAMLPVWGASVIGGYLDDGTQKIFNPSNADVYGRWLGTRYRNKGIIWILGGDTNPVGVVATISGGKRIKPADLIITDYRPVYDAMAGGIIAGDGRTPFISYHITCCSWSGTAQPRTSLYLGDRTWLTMNMLQSSHSGDPKVSSQWTGVSFVWNGTFNYEPIRDEYDSIPTRPVVDGEPRYEGIPVGVRYDPAKGYWTAYDARNAAYHALFAGAAGHTFGNLAVHLSYDPARHSSPQLEEFYPGLKHWREELNSLGAQQMRHVKALMLSRPYFTRIPDQSVIVGDADEGTGHIGATRDKDGSYAMFYLPHAQPITVDMSKIAGLHAVAWWFNPRSGAAQRVVGRLPTTGTATFNPPSSGAENDWVLVVDDESKA